MIIYSYVGSTFLKTKIPFVKERALIEHIVTHLCEKRKKLKKCGKKEKGRKELNCRSVREMVI